MLIDEERSHGVVEVVGPNGVEAVPHRQWMDVADVVLVAFRDHVRRRRTAGVPHSLGQFREDVDRRGIEDCVGGVEPESIEVILVEPVEQVLAEERTGGRRSGPVEVHGGPQGVWYRSVTYSSE